MSREQEQQSTKMPWLLMPWPMVVTGCLTTIGLITLAIGIDSDVTRVAVPGIVLAMATLALAVVTVRLSISERAYQDKLRMADERARELESKNRDSIRAAEVRARAQREKELELASALRQARRIAAENGVEESPNDGGTEYVPPWSTVTIINGSDYPIFDIFLIGARGELPGYSSPSREWPPERRLGGGNSLRRAVLLPGERCIFRGRWQFRKDFIMPTDNIVRELRATYTWTDDQGQAWQRDGNTGPDRLPKPWAWVWQEFWEDTEYRDSGSPG